MDEEDQGGFLSGLVLILGLILFLGAWSGAIQRIFQRIMNLF